MLTDGQAGVMQAVANLAGGVGTNWLFDTLVSARRRIRERYGETPPPEAEVQRFIEQELLAHLDANDDWAVGLRVVGIVK